MASTASGLNLMVGSCAVPSQMSGPYRRSPDAVRGIPACTADSTLRYAEYRRQSFDMTRWAVTARLRIQRAAFRHISLCTRGGIKKRDHSTRASIHAPFMPSAPRSGVYRGTHASGTPDEQGSISSSPRLRGAGWGEGQRASHRLRRSASLISPRSDLALKRPALDGTQPWQPAYCRAGQRGRRTRPQRADVDEPEIGNPEPALTGNEDAGRSRLR
jgi:hypothetical protein